MKKISVIVLLLMAFIYASGIRAQSIFNELWGSAGFTMSRPQLYSINLVTPAEGDDYFNLFSESKDVTGLFLGFKANLFEIKDYFYFGPSVYYQHFYPEVRYEDTGIDEPLQMIDYTISDFSINGDFYFKVLRRERSLFVGLGVGIHDVRFKTNFFLEPQRDIHAYPDFDPVENNEIDDSEKKVAFHLIGKVEISKNVSLEARFEFLPDFNQFKLVWAYSLWDRRKNVEK